MNDEIQDTKAWLQRYFYEKKELAARKRKLAVIENRLGSGVASYEDDGTKCFDTDAARQRHEDALADYSDQQNRVEEQARKVYAIYTQITEAIEELDEPDHRLVAMDRYIFRLKWNDIAELEHISRAQVFRYHGRMLEKMAKIRKSRRFDK